MRWVNAGLLAALLFVTGGIGMDSQEPKKDPPPKVDPEFPDKVTFKRTAPGEQPGKGDWPDVPARRQDVKGEVWWNLVDAKISTVPRGPQPGDTIVEKDGTTWVVKKVLSRGDVPRMVCEKTKDQPKKP